MVVYGGGLVVEYGCTGVVVVVGYQEGPWGLVVVFQRFSTSPKTSALGAGAATEHAARASKVAMEKLNFILSLCIG